MDRTLRGLHKNDSTAQVSESSKLFFKKVFMAFEPKLLIYLVKSTSLTWIQRDILLMTRAPQKDRARIQQRFVTEFVENHSSYWLFAFFAEEFCRS